MAAHVAAARRASPSRPVADTETPPSFHRIVQQTDPGVPGSTMIVGDVDIERSKDVIFDNTTEFQGPVTVHQVHVEDRLPKTKFSGDVEGGDGHDDGDEAKACGMSPYALRRAIVIIVIALIIIVLAVTLGALLHDSNGGDANNGDNEAAVTHTGADAKFGAYDGKDLVLVSRKDWGGMPPVSPADPMTIPIPYVIISHTATEHCRTFQDCSGIVRSVQNYHMKSRKWWDIGYNFLVGGDGRAYEARGWDAVGAHAKSYNNISIGLSFIGTFIDQEPPERQVNAAMRLIEEGVKLHKLDSDYHVLGHRQVSPTESPGEKLFAMLRKWPRFTELDS